MRRFYSNDTKTQESLSKKAAIYVVVKIIALVLVANTVTGFIIARFLTPLSFYGLIFFDTLLLCVFISPVIYIFLFHPLLVTINERLRDQRALQMICDELERDRAILVVREREAEEANKLKDQFLAMVSHELRTPLTAILGWSRLLDLKLRDLNDSSYTHAIEIIERNAKAQVQLIEDLLDVSRIVTGKLNLNTAPVNLVTLADSAIDAIIPAANSKSIELQFEIATDSLPIIGDPQRLNQVFWNLLSNAVKFTPQGGKVKIHLKSAGSKAVVEVSDTGEGIDANFLPHVFERFRQADNSTSRRHGGLGLGLAIVRYLVELQGGTIQAKSDGKGKGATFTIELPLIKNLEPFIR